MASLLKVFDWDKAARIIKERGLTEASAGLYGDYHNTEGQILADGKPYYDDYTYLASVWAVPMLLIYNYDSDDQSYLEEIPCYLSSENTDWDANTKWPQSAIDILSEKGE